MKQGKGPSNWIIGIILILIILISGVAGYSLSLLLFGTGSQEVTVQVGTQTITVNMPIPQSTPTTTRTLSTTTVTSSMVAPTTTTAATTQVTAPVTTTTTPTTSPSLTSLQGKIQFQSVGFGPSHFSVITVPKDSQVQVWVQVQAMGGPASATITTYVKADVEWSFDYFYKNDGHWYPSVNGLEDQPAFSTPVTLANGESKWILVGQFPANMTGFRQYFVRVAINGVMEYDPTDPQTRSHVVIV